MSKNDVRVNTLNEGDARRIRSAAADKLKGRHPTCKSLEEFQSAVYRYFSCFTFAAKGFGLVAESLPKAISAEQRMFIGSGPPENGVALSYIRVSEAHDYSQPDGFFTDAVAKALLVKIYSEWDEKYRAEVGREHGVDAKLVECDLMGDIRLVRNWIVHKKSVVQNNVNQLTIIKWGINVGDELLIGKKRFEHLMVELNQMIVQISPRGR